MTLCSSSHLLCQNILQIWLFWHEVLHSDDYKYEFLWLYRGKKGGRETSQGRIKLTGIWQCLQNIIQTQLLYFQVDFILLWFILYLVHTDTELIISISNNKWCMEWPMTEPISLLTNTGHSMTMDVTVYIVLHFTIPLTQEGLRWRESGGIKYWCS